MDFGSPGAISYERDKCLGNQVIDAMGKRSRTKSLSTAQRKALSSQTDTIDRLLRQGSLDAAEEEINAITADGTVITEKDKSDMLLIINQRKAK